MFYLSVISDLLRKEVVFMSKKTDVMDFVRGWILSGEYKTGQRLPSVAGICDAFDALGGATVAGTTVVNAMATLADEGFVVPLHGDGYYVSEDLPAAPSGESIAKAVADLRVEARRLNDLADRLATLI